MFIQFCSDYPFKDAGSVTRIIHSKSNAFSGQK